MVMPKKGKVLMPFKLFSVIKTTIVKLRNPPEALATVLARFLGRCWVVVKDRSGQACTISLTSSTSVIWTGLNQVRAGLM